MKTNIIKGGKRALGLLLAVCILAVSLFTANIGVNINASAETPAVWGGASDYDNSWTETDGEGNYIIRTAGQLYAMVKDNGMVNGTAASFKVADDVKEIYLTDIASLVKGDATEDEIYAAVAAGNNWNESYTMGYAESGGFSGNFDGNGVAIYGLNANATVRAGFILGVANNYNVSIKNVAFKYSNITNASQAGQRAAVVVASGDGWYTTDANTCVATLESIEVSNAKFTNNNTSANKADYFAGLVATPTATNFVINNCLVADIGDNASAFAKSYIEAGKATFTVNSSVAINTNVASLSSATYTNCYSTYASDASTINKLTDVSSIKGAVAKTNMPALDWSGTWFAVDDTSTYPQLRVFHNIIAVNNGDGTHNEKCTDCGLVGLSANHFYDIEDEVYNKTYCACGLYIDGLFDVWDSEGAIDSDFEGKGTEEEPYIINTVEELYGMVRSSGVDANGNALYYKVADGVSALYINDTRGYTSQTAFEEAAAAGSLMNWSTGLTKESDFCTDGGSCKASNGTTEGIHKDAYVDHFGGKFDGNGVTIYGLYSKSTATAYWANGAGFVPMLTGDATIKNVIFDTNYVNAPNGFAAVISASTGIWIDQYKRDTDGDGTYETYSLCPYVEEHVPVPSECNAVIMNVVVRKAYIGTTSCGLDSSSYAAGFVSALLEPHTINFINCLFDGSNSTLVTTGTDKSAGIYSTRQGYTADSWIESCLVVNSASTTMDVVSAVRWEKATTDFAHNSYAYGSTAANTTLGTLKADGYTTVDALPLLNWTAWDIDAVDTYGTPMPKLVDGWQVCNFRYYKDAFKNSEYYTNPEGATPVDAGYEQGIFSDFDELVGSGTEADPYIIDNANLLFEIIASGGTNRGIGQYFKLACDLDLGGIQWVNYPTDADVNDGTNQETGESWHKVYYQYKAFAGAIDGDGHTITGMYTATTDTNAGFIPELAATGVVKNLHFRNSYAYASGGNYGVIAGTAASGSVISGCSIDGSENAKFVGYGTATITNSYITVDDSTTYYLADGNTGTPEVDGVTWYQGGADGSKPKLVNHADAMPCADVDGDGNGYEYTTSDLSALKQKLTRKSAYANVYGDVSRNGKTDIRDMVILQREIDPDDIVSELDGFWKNVKAGNFSIWYDENDNYDAARKMELYLEEVTGVDVAKTKGTTTSNLTIRIVTDADLDANNYSVSYDLETGVLTISGGSFTAVEQGVLYFINGSDVTTGHVETGSGSLTSVLNSNGEAYKTAVPVGGQTYHYVWGDEFDSGDTVNIDGTDYSTVSYDKWLLRNKTVDTTDDHKTEFAYISAATDAQAPGINAVSDGKLTLKRGINSSTDMYASGISSKNSMLYKRGYAEMLVTLPSDGYAFPSWWLLTSPNVYTNYGVQRSLYGKVYELNDSGIYKFDGTTSIFSADDPTTFQYKLPTQTLEIDIFEIIQKPSVSRVNLTYAIAASTDYDVSFNIHKWYSHATVKDDNTLTVYDLDWANVETNGGFTNKLLTANGSNGENYTGTNTSDYSTYDKIYVHTANLADGQANGSITYQGGKSNASATPDGAAGDSMNVNMANYRSDGKVKQLKYGFLWTENDMTFSIYEGSTLVYSTTVDKNAMNYNNAESYSAGNYGFDQYAYMLIENHWYSASYRTANSKWYYASISDCDMEIEYVRLYQLDGARDIVTPETEAFNKNDRFAD